MQRLIYWTWLLLVCVVGAVRAELVIEITRGVENPIKVAVVPFRFQGSGVLDVDLARLIESNLERTGQFQRVNRNSMLSLPGPNDQLFYRDWRAIDSEYTVVGEITPNENGYLVTFGLHDVLGQRELFAEKVPGPASALRDIGHYISDKIYESLTGIKGIFSTKLLPSCQPARTKPQPSRTTTPWCLA